MSCTGALGVYELASFSDVTSLFKSNPGVNCMYVLHHANYTSFSSASSFVIFCTSLLKRGIILSSFVWTCTCSIHCSVWTLWELTWLSSSHLDSWRPSDKDCFDLCLLRDNRSHRWLVVFFLVAFVDCCGQTLCKAQIVCCGCLRLLWLVCG